MRPVPVISILLLLAAGGFAQSTQPAKKLIEFGWDEPDTAFLRAHIAQMEQTPFNGTVFHVMYASPDGKRGSFMNECWSRRAFTAKELSAALTDLQATPWHTFTDNFLRFNVCPGDVDWFDDFGAITGNARLAAQLAAAGKAKGILFDIEQYNTRLFDFAKARDATTKSFDQYAAQTRQRGREVMTAFQDGYPGLTVFLTYGYSLPHAQVGLDKSKLPAVDYGLLLPFLDGLFDAAKGKSRIVDGFEMSYGYKTKAQFDKIPPMVKQTLLPLVGTDHEQYLDHLSLGFGLWMDNDWRRKGWNTSDFTKNYFTPAEFETGVRMALETADEYVWIYTEEPKWWTPPSGASAKLPDAYVQSIHKALGR